MPTRWLILAVLAGPMALSVGQSGSFAQAKNNLFIHLGLGLAAWSVTSWWLRGLLAWTWATWVFSGMRGWAFIGVLGVLAWALVFHAASSLTETGWRNVRRAIAAAALGQVALMALQAAGWRPFSWIGLHVTAVAGVGGAGARLDPSLPLPAFGWFGNPMDAAIYLGLSLPATHPVPGVAIALATLALVSTAGLACVVLWLLALAWGRGWHFGVATSAWGAAGIVAYLTWVDVGGLAHRPLAWKAAWVAWLAAPWGYGVNALDYRVVIGSSVGTWNFLFNEWLQWGIEAGVLGVGLVAAFVAWLGWRTWATWPRGRALVLPALMLLVLSTASIPFRIGPTAFLSALYLGRLYAEVTT